MEYRAGWRATTRQSYDDENRPYTPAWSEKYTGMGRETLIRFAREWGNTARLTKGKCTVIIGAGINHWYHNNLMYRAPHLRSDVLRLCRCERRRPGALRWTGEACAWRIVVLYRIRTRLEPGGASAECAELALHQHRSVALRAATSPTTTLSRSTSAKTPSRKDTRPICR